LEAIPQINISIDVMMS